MLGISNRCYTSLSFAWTLTIALICFTIYQLDVNAADFFGYWPATWKSESAWHDNLSLMQDAQNKTDDPALKNRIRFLAVNYLNKVAPLMPHVARLMSLTFFESAFQVSPYSPYQYHRAFGHYRPDIGSFVNSRFALGDNFALGGISPLILTDTDQFEHFLPLKFIVLNRENRRDWESLISKAMETDGEILFDFTHDIGDSILTELDSEKEQLFSENFNGIKEEIDALILSMEEKHVVRNFLKQKSTAIARIKFECHGEWIGGMKILPLFSELTHENMLDLHPTLVRHFVEETGIALGAIRLRRLIPEVFPLPDYTSTPNEEFSTLHFPTKADFIQSIHFDKIRNSSNKAHVGILGGSFLNMLEGLMSKIEEEKWEEIQQNPAMNEIFQIVLFKIIHHLTHAEKALEENNNNLFIQDMELAYAELGTILDLTNPYKAEDFRDIYLNQLKIIPSSLRPFLKGGMSKTAETVFAEAIVAVRSQDPNCVCTYCDFFYYEHANLLEKSQKIDEMTEDKEIEQIHLYGCTFNPSIDGKRVDAYYGKRDLIQDVEKILAAKSPTDYLTVAIDFTNDYFNSAQTQALLEHFEQEILNGRLNVVCFGSGQKFDMLGMDHFYGSPFYMINNGSQHWQAFDKLFTEEVHQTDLLSIQWFSLLYEYASESVDYFRTCFYDNMRHIIQNIPQELFWADRKIVVSKSDINTDLTFIDIKIKGVFHRTIASLLVNSYQRYAVANKVKSSIRGSFGFLHPNVTLIFAPDFTTLRIHPGMLRSDNEPIIQFLQRIA